jgi:hypothetical protein
MQVYESRKPIKKTVCVATLLGEKFRVEVKQKAEAYYDSIKDKPKVEVFETLLGSKYTITKQLDHPDHFEVVKSSKKEIMREVPPPFREEDIHIYLEKQTIYQVSPDVATIFIDRGGQGDNELQISSDTNNMDAIRAEVRTLNPPSRRSSSTKSRSSKSSTKSVKSSSEKHGKEWVLPNRTGFSKWMYKAFSGEKYHNDAFTESSHENVRLFAQQRLIRDFMQFYSPYRGILLYHGLGVGKTCASIAAAEGFLQRNKKVFVLVPASLVQNYKNEILRCASIGNPSKKLWNISSLPANKDHPDVKRVMEVYGIPYEVIKKHHKRMWLPYITDGVPFTRRNVAWNNLNEAERADLMEFMQAYVDTKYTFISYNGINTKGVEALGKSPFDDAFIVMDEAHNFISRVNNGGKIAKKLYTMMMDAKRSKMILLSGTPVINHPYELCILLNLVRGPATLYKYKVSSPSASHAALESAGLLKYIDSVSVSEEDKTVTIQLLPLDFVRARADGSGYAIKHEKWEADPVDRVKAALSARKPMIHEAFALPSSKEEFKNIFLDETDQDNPIVKNDDLFMRRIMGIVSYFKTAGEEYFPAMLPQVRERIPMSPYQFSNYVDVRDKERKMENKKKQFGAAAAGGLFAKKGTVYRAFSRMACNFVFPEHIKRPFPGDLKRELKKEISANEEDHDVEEDVNHEEAAEKLDKRVAKQYEAELKEAMGKLREHNGPLELQKLRELYSPKFAKITEDILESPGSCLLYSQFRTVEGIGILRYVLEQAGFVEVVVEKKANGDWVIADAATVLDPVYNGKRFVIFNEDREKTNMLIKIYNGAINDVPASIASVLRDAGFTNNLRGDLARLIMISQSGAEGISLRNVRRVFITEPFWNKVRIDQVIGRAVRAGSHLDLPPDERNVQVFTYVSVFSPAQLRSNFTLQRLDKSQTSDEHIYDIATHKSRIIDQFLDMMKRAAFDCVVNAGKNAMLSSGTQCYAFPINKDDQDFAYLSTLDEEKKELQKTKLERTRRVRGRVVIVNGSRGSKKAVAVDGLEGLFDYRAYKDAGVLLPTSH